ncbi:hypothetical protein Tco_1040751 [Tanacetum coccineum]
MMRPHPSRMQVLYGLVTGKIQCVVQDMKENLKPWTWRYANSPVPDRYAHQAHGFYYKMLTVIVNAAQVKKIEAHVFLRHKVYVNQQLRMRAFCLLAEVKMYAFMRLRRLLKIKTTLLLKTRWEKALSQEHAKVNQSLFDASISENLKFPYHAGNYMAQMSVAMNKLSNFEDIVNQDENLLHAKLERLHHQSILD